MTCRQPQTVQSPRVQCCPILYCILCTAVQYCTVLHCTVLYKDTSRAYYAALCTVDTSTIHMGQRLIDVQYCSVSAVLYAGEVLYVLYCTVLVLQAWSKTLWAGSKSLEALAQSLHASMRASNGIKLASGSGAFCAVQDETAQNSLIQSSAVQCSAQTYLKARKPGRWQDKKR